MCKLVSFCHLSRRFSVAAKPQCTSMQQYVYLRVPQAPVTRKQKMNSELRCELFFHCFRYHERWHLLSSIRGETLILQTLIKLSGNLCFSASCLRELLRASLRTFLLSRTKVILKNFLLSKIGSGRLFSSMRSRIRLMPEPIIKNASPFFTSMILQKSGDTTHLFPHQRVKMRFVGI